MFSIQDSYLSQIKPEAQSITGWLLPSMIFGSWILTGVIVAISIFYPNLPSWAIYSPFLISFVFLGLPHGAVDHWILLGLKNHTFSIPNMVRVVLPYVTLSAAYLLLWIIAPALSLLIFILMTWFHWGQGDVYSIHMFTGRQHLKTRLHTGLALFIRGALPMLIPLLSFPEIYQGVVVDVIRILDNSYVAETNFLFSDLLRLIAGLTFSTCVLVYFAITFQRSSSWYYDLIEVCLLVFLFSIVHPILAIGVYFCFWHGLRHIVRIMITHSDQGPGYNKGPLKQFVLQAAPTTLIALIILGGMYFFAPNQPHTIQDFTALYLILIAILTLPHVWVVILMDRKDKIWTSLD